MIIQLPPLPEVPKKEESPPPPSPPAAAPAATAAPTVAAQPVATETKKGEWYSYSVSHSWF